MEELLGLIAGYNDLCLHELSQFWGFSLDFTPKLELGTRTEEYPLTKRMVVSEEDILRYAETIAKKTRNSIEVGMLHFSGHAMNHFFATNQNKNMYTRPSIGQFPVDPDKHIAIVEAVVCVPTAWLLEKEGYTGERIIGEYFNLWEDQLIRRKKAPTIAGLSRQAYHKLKQIGRPEFIQFVRDYSDQVVYDL